ncbi:hypothetical protein GQ607_003439 [Colletotrichum asianum]|uniref:Uncharacterized protein n=1 Tax=Colletotrichum asianum TaxID=702518 RepID=A0A8H3WNN3_9PEZI|nr:hypothetical protein GQ607_003439 [Colletotrichum asianum]
MSTASSRIPDMTDSSTSLEGESFFQEAIALAEQTLKLSSGGALLCPATRREAKCMLESAKLGMSPTSKKHKFFTTERVRSDHDLITELCQIFREHYILKYMNCRVEDLPVELHRLGGAKSHRHHVDIIHTRINPTWNELVQGLQKETSLITKYEHALNAHTFQLERQRESAERTRFATLSATTTGWGQTASEQNQKSSAPPVRLPTPSTDIVERIAHLFCESAYTYDGIIQDFLQIITEHTAGTVEQRDFNRYKDKLLRGEYEEVAYHIRSDRENLKTRLHRVEDAILVSKIGDAIDKKDRFLFMVHKSIWSDSMDRPDWRLYPSKEAVEMSVFQEYWKDRPRRRDDSYDSDDYPDDDPPRGLGPFGW